MFSLICYDLYRRRRRFVRLLFEKKDRVWGRDFFFRVVVRSDKKTKNRTALSHCRSESVQSLLSYTRFQKTRFDIYV